MRKRIPAIIQQDAMDCGVACAAMVCKWYGIPCSIPELKETCIPTKEGISLKRIASTLETLGFNVVGGRATTQLLIEKAVLPVILHWDQNHFIVLFRINKKQGIYNFHVSDPAMGVVTYTQAEFEDKWLSTKTDGADKGVALFIYNNNRPASESKRQGECRKSTSLKTLLPLEYHGQELRLGLLS